jgi:N-acyl-D-aspartate/D-glutamate deacylase
LGAATLLDDLPSFQELRPLEPGARLAGIRDPQRRARLIAEAAARPVEPFEGMYLMEPARGAVYEYGPDDSLAAVARATGRSPIEVYLDALDVSDGAAVVNWPVLNQDFGAIAELLASPHTIMGLADAGAHATQIMDASQATFFLSHWVRDRAWCSIEEGVRRLTSDTASFAGFVDRGVIEPGAYADLNVIDLDALALPLPEIVFDFPGGAPRFVQRARGVDATFVNGVLLMDHGVPTGATPGRLIRAGQAPRR